MRPSVFCAEGVLLLASILVSLPVSAETLRLSLPQTIEASLGNNGELASFREEKGIRDAGRIRAGVLPNPIVEIEGATGALTGSSSESTLSVGVFQEFFLGGKREKKLHVAERELEVFRWQLAARERAVLEEVKTAFYDLLLAEQRLAVADRSIELNRQLSDVARERLAAGDIPELEMNLVKVELARSKGARIELVKTLNQKQARLLTLMGLPAGQEVRPVGKLEDSAGVHHSLDDLKRRALHARPDLKALEAEKGKGEADMDLARAEGVPNVTAGLAARRDTTSIQVGGVEGKETSYTLALKLSVPIPVFDRNGAGVQEARARQNSTESRLAAMRMNSGREVEAAYAGCLDAQQIVSLFSADILPQLEENLKLTQEAYRLGEIGVLEVIQEQKKFIEVSDSYLAALHDRQMALVKLETAVGTELSGGTQ